MVTPAGDPNDLRVHDFVITDEFSLISEASTLADGIDKLLDMRRGVLLVEGSDSEVKGVVTERQILRNLRDGATVDAAVTTIMDTHILHIKHDSLLKDALEEIHTHKPVAVIVDDSSGNFAGYFSPVDYLAAEKALKGQ